ncbi:MAG TPA: cupin domain-containing protein [Acidimicrobiia bacterium]
METHDLRSSFDGLGEIEFNELERFCDGTVGVFWAGSGVSPWERHPADEELLFVMEGRVTIEVLTEDDSVEVSIEAGNLFVVPRNRWHRHKHDGVVKELYVTPGTSDMSFADDPRTPS